MADIWNDWEHCVKCHLHIKNDGTSDILIVDLLPAERTNVAIYSRKIVRFVDAGGAYQGPKFI